jgi:hypothetical protein
MDITITFNRRGDIPTRKSSLNVYSFRIVRHIPSCSQRQAEVTTCHP